MTNFFEGFAKGALKGGIDILDQKAAAKASAEEARRKRFDEIDIYAEKTRIMTEALDQRNRDEADMQAAKTARENAAMFGEEVQRLNPAEPAPMEDMSAVTVPDAPISVSDLPDDYGDPIENSAVSRDTTGMKTASAITKSFEPQGVAEVSSFRTRHGFDHSVEREQAIRSAPDSASRSQMIKRFRTEDAAIAKKARDNPDIASSVLQSLEEQGLATDKAQRFFKANPPGTKMHERKSAEMTKYLNSKEVQEAQNSRRTSISKGLVAQSIIESLPERTFLAAQTTFEVVDDAVMAAKAAGNENIGAFNREASELGLLQKTLLNYTGAMSNYELQFFKNSVLSLYRSKRWNTFQTESLIKTTTCIDDMENYRNALLDEIPSKAVVDDMLKEYIKNVPLTAIDANGIPRAIATGDTLANGDVVPTVEEYFAHKAEGRTFKIPQRADRFVGQDKIDSGEAFGEKQAEEEKPKTIPWGDL